MLIPDNLFEFLFKIRQFCRNSIKYEYLTKGKTSEQINFVLTCFLTDSLLNINLVKNIRLKYRVTTFPIG